MKHSNSSVSTYFRCPREYKHKYIDKRVAPESTYEMEFGSAFHEHLEKGTEPELDNYTNVRMHVMLLGYRATYSDDPLLQREIPWEHEDEHGIFDGVGDGYLIEDKTTKNTIGEYYWARKVLDSQVNLYLWAAYHLGLNAKHMRYRVTRHAPLKHRPAEDFYIYHERYMKHLKKYQHGVFVEQIMYQDEAARHRFELSRAQAKHLIGHSTAAGSFPQNTNSCFAFNRSCMYLPVCTGETTIEDNNLYSIRKRK